MITAMLHFDASFSAMIRGTTSNNGPGGTGTTILIVRLGKSSTAANLVVMPARQTAVQSQVISEERSCGVIRGFLQLAKNGRRSQVFVGGFSFKRRTCDGANCPGGARR